MSERLIGLDIARYLAFVGMVLVNFDIAMSYGVQSNEGFFKELVKLPKGGIRPHRTPQELKS